MSARGTSLRLQTVTEFFIEECCNCGVLFAMTDEFKTARNRDKRSFYCPNGHDQHYLGKTHDQIVKDLEREREAEATRARALADQLAAAKREATRLAARTREGVCPCCQRSFIQLARHIKCKHPEYGAT